MFLKAVVTTLLFMVPMIVSSEASPELIVILDPGHGGNDQGGYDGKGFTLEDGRKVPEDAYMYDIALRILEHAHAEPWKMLLTVFAENIRSSHDVEQPNILPPLYDLVYNLRLRDIRVYNGKEGVRKRLDVSNQIPNITEQNAVFISLHFDFAPDYVSGTRIFTTKEGARHPFVQILAKSFSHHSLSLFIRGQPKPSITINENLIVLGEGSIMPRVLIEFGNWNAPRDRSLLLSHDGRELYAKAIISALKQYFMELKQ